jgi:hypothetical protein
MEIITCTSCSNILTVIEDECIDGLCWECCEKKHLLEEIDCKKDKCFLYLRGVCRAATLDNKGGHVK